MNTHLWIVEAKLWHSDSKWLPLSNAFTADNETIRTIFFTRREARQAAKQIENLNWYNKTRADIGKLVRYRATKYIQSDSH